MKEYHTFTYIMYKENLEREKREAEEAAKRADVEKQNQQREEQKHEQMRPKTRAEILLEARKNSGFIPVQKSEPQSQESNIEQVEYDPRFTPPSIMDEFVDYLEDEI